MVYDSSTLTFYWKSGQFEKHDGTQQGVHENEMLLPKTTRTHKSTHRCIVEMELYSLVYI